MKNMSTINIILLIIASTFLFSGLCVIASINMNKILPPSKAGIGSRLTTPILTDNNAMNNNSATIPAAR